MTSQILAAVAAVGLIGAGVAGAAETRAFDAIPAMQTIVGAGEGVGGGGADSCIVRVNRGGTPGSVNITKAVEGSQCFCDVLTGPASGNGSAESIVQSLGTRNECTDAALASTAQTAAGTNSVLVVVGAVGVAGGLGLALANKSKG